MSNEYQCFFIFPWHNKIGLWVARAGVWNMDFINEYSVKRIYVQDTGWITLFQIYWNMYFSGEQNGFFNNNLN